MYPPFLTIILDCECKHLFGEGPAFHLFHFNVLNISIIHEVCTVIFVSIKPLIWRAMVV